MTDQCRLCFLELPYLINNTIPFLGFRGCLSNFTLLGELQPLTASSPFTYLTMTGNSGPIIDGCDLAILQSSHPSSPVNVGVVVIIVFFVFLITAICVSFTGNISWFFYWLVFGLFFALKTQCKILSMSQFQFSSCGNAWRRRRTLPV